MALSFFSVCCSPPYPHTGEVAVCIILHPVVLTHSQDASSCSDYFPQLFQGSEKPWIGADTAPQPSAYRNDWAAWMVFSLLLFKFTLVRDCFPPVLMWYTDLGDTSHQPERTLCFQGNQEGALPQGLRQSECAAAAGPAGARTSAQPHRGTSNRKTQRTPLLRPLTASPGAPGEAARTDFSSFGLTLHQPHPQPEPFSGSCRDTAGVSWVQIKTFPYKRNVPFLFWQGCCCRDWRQAEKFMESCLLQE